MRIETTLRASVQLQQLDGELKEWVSKCLAALEAGTQLPAEPLRTIPKAFVMKFNDYRLVFKREGDVIEVQDIIVLDPELRSQLQEMAGERALRKEHAR